jgi:hypothetical protein
MIFLPSPSPEELGAEAREALRRVPPKTGHELFVRLVRKGFINSRWEVTKLIGGTAEPEPDYQTWSDDKPKRKKAK